jgi:succinyl-CoA:acetate CoA-transferase
VQAIADKVISAEGAAALISPGDRIGMSGFTGSGHPKAVPAALVRRAVAAAARGDHFAVSVWTASAAPQLGGALAAVDGTDLRMPYQSDPVTRAKINGGLLGYLDAHLSHVAQMVRGGFFGHLDVAVVEVAGITADGALIPSSSVGNNNTWIDMADRVILEVNLPALLVGEDHRGRLDKRSGLRRPVQARRSRFAAYRRSSPGLSEPRIQSRAAARHVAAASVRRG